MEKKCKSCGEFELYYTKGYCEFFESQVGYCRLKDEITPKHGVCEKWRTKYEKREIDKPRVKKALEKSMTDIAAIAQIFAEEQDDNARP